MNLSKNNEFKSEPINWVLIAISFLVLSGLGLIFITQMEFQSGWFYQDLRETYSIDMYAFESDDINGDGKKDIISYIDISRRDDYVKPEYDTPKFGAIIAHNGKNGNKLWSHEYTGPVKKVFPLPDLDGDSIKDYFINIATVNESWYNDSSEWNNELKPYIYIDQFTNKIISGGNKGNDIEIDDALPNTGFIDVKGLDNLTDNIADLFCLEFYNGSYDGDIKNYDVNITSYFSNGTQAANYNFTSCYDLDDFYINNFFPCLDFFTANYENYLLLIGDQSVSLLNLTTLDPFNPVYEYTLKDYDQNIIDFIKVRDLNADGNEELLISSRYHEQDNKINISLLDGSNFSLRDSINVTMNEGFDYNNVVLEELLYKGAENKSYILIKTDAYNEETKSNKYRNYVYELNSFYFEENPLWEYERTSKNEEIKIYVLEEDIDGDLLGEIVLYEPYNPLLSINTVSRYKIINPRADKVLAITNTDQWVKDIITIEDFNGDNKKDYLVMTWQSLMALSSQDPTPIFLSSFFPLGIPLFIVFVAMIIIGIFLLIKFGKKLTIERDEIVKNLKTRKVAVIVNIIVISLMTLTFLMFLLQINIFNQTLITGHFMTNISIAFLTTSIIWYSLLPLTAAIYNHFAPKFAYFFIWLRNFSFKISKRYNNDIFVLDMEGRDEIGLLIKLKRVLLPLFFSIAIGFYIYNTAAPILGYPRGFDIFASEEFFSFIVGFNILCVLPMIMTYIIFSFFIAGNFLLDDAGIVYFRQPKKHRQPGDIEPISIWAQSIIKGVAGISAIITFVQFFSTVDFSGFFEGEGIFILFGFFMTVVFFWGIPFLTAFSYILLAEEIMDFSLGHNKKKLYKIMEDNGFDTKPRKITNLRPSGENVSTLPT